MSDPSPEALSAISTLSLQTLLLGSLLVATLLIALLVYVARKKSSSQRSAILLLGPSDAGKTAILTTLVYRQTLPTHASLQTNSSALRLSSTTKTPLRVVDVPGHPRLRDEFKEYLLDAKAVAFVVDASTIARNGPTVAEHLHRVLHALTSLPPTHTPPALSILAHKADLLAPSALATSAGTAAATPRAQLAVSRVRTILERELEKRRASHAGGVGVEGLSADDAGAELGGLECGGTGGAFRFADWEGGEVAFLGTEVRVGGTVDEDDDEKGESDNESEEQGADGLASFREWLEDVY